jgi:hypothetical protein
MCGRAAGRCRQSDSTQVEGLPIECAVSHIEIAAIVLYEVYHSAIALERVREHVLGGSHPDVEVVQPCGSGGGMWDREESVENAHHAGTWTGFQSIWGRIVASALQSTRRWDVFTAVWLTSACVFSLMHA